MTLYQTGGGVTGKAVVDRDQTQVGVGDQVEVEVCRLSRESRGQSGKYKDFRFLCASATI